MIEGRSKFRVTRIPLEDRQICAYYGIDESEPEECNALQENSSDDTLIHLEKPEIEKTTAEKQRTHDENAIADVPLRRSARNRVKRRENINSKLINTEKPEIEKPTAEKQQTHDENAIAEVPLRRSARNRVKRLDPSINQRPVYENTTQDENANAVVPLRRSARNRAKRLDPSINQRPVYENTTQDALGSGTDTVSSKNSSSRTRRRRIDNRSFYHKLLDTESLQKNSSDDTLMHLEKPEIEKPTAEKQQTHDENANAVVPLRRSARNRVKRLDPSINQRPVYEYTTQGPSLVDVTDISVRRADRKQYAHYAKFLPLK